MTDVKLPSAAFRGPIAQEIANWLCEIRSRRTESAPKLLCIKSRLLYASVGSFTWMIGFVFAVTGNPTLANIYSVGVTLDVFGVLGVMSVVSLWFGWLVAFSDRKASPVRLFLDGLLLPTATVSIIAFAMGRIVQIPDDSSQSPGITFPSEGAAEESGETPN